MADILLNHFASVSDGAENYLYKTLSLPSKSTFEHNDKIVLDDNDDLYYDPVASIQIEAVCSYLKQT